MELLKKGAEAEIWLDRERGVIVKRRVPKRYRNPELDRRIRRLRTNREVKLLRLAKQLDIPVPRVFEHTEDTIVMEYIEGVQLKRVVEPHHMERIGEFVSRLHAWGATHGDLTTSNVILREDLYLIDFGLGEFTKRVEDFAVDIVCFKKSYFATHPDLPEGWSAFLEGYQWEKRGEVMRQVERVERRARYL